MVRLDDPYILPTGGGLGDGSFGIHYEICYRDRRRIIAWPPAGASVAHFGPTLRRALSRAARPAKIQRRAALPLRFFAAASLRRGDTPRSGHWQRSLQAYV